MTEADPPRPNAGLVYEDRIPVGWQVLAERPAAWQLLKNQQSNEQVLRWLASVDEQSHRAEGDDEHGPVASDIARLESRLNLLLDMVGRLLGQQAEMPPSVPVRMNADGLQWQTPEAPPAGALVGIELYLNPRIPSPILLHGHIVDVTPIDDGYQVELRYLDLTEQLRNWIEKLVFRQHRRLVALARQGA